MFTPVLKLEHSDSRGEIYSVTLPGERELMLLHSKEGSLRGGHAHDVDEIVVMLTGKMRYHIKNDKDEYEEIALAGESTFHPASEYHMGEFLEDTWLIEWKIGTSKGQSKNIDDPAWRERVKTNVTK